MVHAAVSAASATDDQPGDAATAADARATLQALPRAGDATCRLHQRLSRAEMLSQAGKHADAEAGCLALLKEYNTAGDVREVRMVLSAAYSTAHRQDKSEEQLLLVLKADADDATA